MAITNSDVKLFESQRLTDEEDGGGWVTGNEVVDGNVNNLFQDISRIDGTIGDVALRKSFIGISTDNNDIYLGSHLILTKSPKDKNVSVLLFNTDSQTDERLGARDRIESYVIPSIKASWELVGDQLEGQRAIVGYQREEWRSLKMVKFISSQHLMNRPASLFVLLPLTVRWPRLLSKQFGVCGL